MNRSNCHIVGTIKRYIFAVINAVDKSAGLEFVCRYNNRYISSLARILYVTTKYV